MTARFLKFSVLNAFIVGKKLLLVDFQPPVQAFEVGNAIRISVGCGGLSSNGW
jgi:hypothetical protein